MNAQAHFFTAFALVVALILGGSVHCGWAAQVEVDLTALLHETQKMSQDAGESVLVWWIPDEYWRASQAKDPRLTQAQVEEFVRVLHPYVFVVVARGRIGPFAGVTFESEDSIRNNIELVDREGDRYQPLSDDSIDADTKNLLSVLKPVWTNVLGPLGQNMHPFLFAAKNIKGKSLADATEEGKFSIDLGKRKFTWRLPLGSLLPVKTCPKCGELLNGAFKYCPYDGTSLPK